MKRILFILVAIPLAVVMLSGCAKDGDVPPVQLKHASTKKVEAEFISMEAAPKDLERLGIDWLNTNTSSSAQRQDK